MISLTVFYVKQFENWLSWKIAAFGDSFLVSTKMFTFKS